MTTLGEAPRGINPNHTEVSPERRARMHEVFPSTEQMIKDGFRDLFGIDNAPIDIHGHDGSKATYIAFFDEEDDRYRGSFMDEGERTSKAHMHVWPKGRIKPATVLGNKVNIAEEYYVLAGEAILELEENGEKREVVLNESNPSFVVNSGVLHAVRTEEKPVLMVLKTRYEALLDPSEVHIRP